MTLPATTIALPRTEQKAKTSWKVWLGRVLSAQPILALLASAGLKLTHEAKMVEHMGALGFSPSKVTIVGLLALSCAVLSTIPTTAVLGMALTTAYFGGAVATHLHADEPVFVPIMLGTLGWLGLYLRYRRLHGLLPLKREQAF
jgi:hypothetical protein